MRSVNRVAIGIASNGRGAGKSTLAEALHTCLGLATPHVARLSMATALRQAVQAFCGRLYRPLPDEALGRLKDHPLEGIPGSEGWGDVTGRDLLLAYGNSLRDVFGQDFWAKAWAWTAEGFALSHPDNMSVVICDDMRTPEEMAAVKAFPGVTVYLFHQDAKGGEMEGQIDPNDCHLFLRYEHTRESLREAVAFILEYLQERLPGSLIFPQGGR